MPIVHSVSITLGGKSFAQSRTVNAGSEITREGNYNKGYGGVLTTRTDNDTGVITLSTSGAGANFSVGDRVDVYWDVGGQKGHRRGMKVSSKTGDAITVGTGAGDVGSGDNFPSVNSDVVLSKCTELEMRFDGDDLIFLAVSGESRCLVVFADSSDVELHFVHNPLPGQVYTWYKDIGQANPLAGDVVSKVFVSNYATDSNKNIKIGVAID